MLRELWSSTSGYFWRPVALWRNYDRQNLRADALAGLTVAVVLLPQAIAFAMIAELPPAMGLYTAIVTTVVGALWGSSHHLNTGPTNTTSLLVLSILLPLAEVGSEQFLVAAGLMAVMVGIFQIALGVARLGLLVNFVSDSVVIGFTAGAGVLIGVNQLRHLFRLDFSSSSSLIITLQRVITHILETHNLSFLIGGSVIIILVLIKRFAPKLPGALIAMVLGAGIVGFFRLDQAGVIVIGELPRSLPPFTKLQLFDVELIGQISTGALAVGAISLVESIAISRSIASQSGQQLDSNQEFIGQGLSNLLTGFFSGYAVSGSFTRSAVNYAAGARTSVSSIFSSLFIISALLLLAPLAAYVPRAALAGVLLVTAYSIIDQTEIARIWRGTRGDAIIMAITFLSTLLLPLQFAVLAGILLSLIVYILRTSVPRVVSVTPASDFTHFTSESQQQLCAQLAILDILGDFYFGAVTHVEEAIRAHLNANPSQRFLLLRMYSVDQIDISGVHALESIVRTLRERGGDVFMMRTQEPVMTIFKSTGFYETLGADHFLAFGDAVSHLFYRILDPTICIYECNARAFLECQNLPKRIKLPGDLTFPTEIPTEKIESITSLDLWGSLHKRNPPIVVDVREPREFRRGHIPEAKSIPLFELLSDPADLPKIRPVVLVCRSGRRSTRAAFILGQRGFLNLQILDGGMLTWENDGLLTAVEF
jgi:sulfate permease, SulP family